jgi:hypothetical protein
VEQSCITWKPATEPEHRTFTSPIISHPALGCAPEGAQHWVLSLLLLTPADLKILNNVLIMHNNHVIVIRMKKDTSKDAVNVRLQELREEFAKGQEVQKDLQRQMTQLTESMLRISGAIQVLEELKGTPEEPVEVAL